MAGTHPTHGDQLAQDLRDSINEYVLKEVMTMAVITFTTCEGFVMLVELS